MPRRAPDGGDDEDHRYAVAGDDLRKILRRGRRRPVPFAFTPGKGEDESLFAVHKKRPPEMIAKATRRESGQTKVAFGTFVVQGKELILTCIQELPAIARKLKKHLRQERLPMNIRVLDITGREIEADIEDLGDADVLGDDPGDDDDDDGDGDLPRVTTTGDRMLDRLAAIRDAVMAAPGDAGDRLRDIFAGALRAADNGSRDKADKLISQVEAELRRQMNSAARTAFAGTARPAPARRPDDVPVPPAAPRHAEPGRADLLPLARRARALKARAEGMGDALAPRLMAALAVAARALRAGEVAAATDALDRIEAAMDRVAAG
jgi:hypothetical protein